MRRGRALRALAALPLVAACAGPGPRQPIDAPAVDRLLAEARRVLWVAAHPDDESMAGGVLSRACIAGGATCHFLVFNRGAGGECNLDDGCKPDLATVRHRELVKAARLYRATLEHYELYNAPLPVESFPSRPELERRWMSEGDPAGLVARAVRRFRPELVVTLDPYHGFTGHPEHQAAARFALAGIRLAADPGATGPMLAGESPHRVSCVIHVQNKYWFMAAAGDGYDPHPWHDSLDARASCGPGRDGQERPCLDVVAAITRSHRSQDRDMGAIRAASPFWGTTYVRRVDPFGREAEALVAEIGPPGGKR
jgi:LmbE family N-acetylglucosaminyl deacetylase